MRQYLILIALVFPINLFGQPVIGMYAALADPESSILTCTKRKQGLYKTFEEFKTNNPSITEGYTIKEEIKTLPAGHVGKVYRLIPDSGAVNSRKDLKRLFWGFCQNDSIYFSTKNIEDKFRPSLYYLPFEFLGRYSFVRDVGYSFRIHQRKAAFNAGGLVGVAIADAAGAYDSDKITVGGTILNFNNGEFYTIDRSLLRTILEKDTALLEEFNRERAKTESELEIYQLHEKIIRAYDIKYSKEAKLEIKR
jgi:hypothetical protein